MFQIVFYYFFFLKRKYKKLMLQFNYKISKIVNTN